MDPVVEQALLGVASNALYDFMVRAIGETADDANQDAAAQAVSAALASLADVPEISPALGGERCRDLLLADETRNIIRQLYASSSRGEVIAKTGPQFRELWRARTGRDGPEAMREASRLFDSIVSLCERSLTQAIANGDLSAHEARSARRHAELRDALANVQQGLDALTRVSKADIDRIDEFATTYRAQVAAREGVLTPPALETARRIPIDDLYVPARLETTHGSERERLEYRRFFSHLYRAVVLGNPGSGKSTLAKKVATDLASGRGRLSAVASAVVPFLVVLRDFGAYKKDNPCSIVDFISITSNSHYQVQPPPGAIEYLLATNRAMVIFDGLDELLDTSHRAEISADVESLTSLYPATPVLVTSREVGYSQAPLSTRTFTTFRLAEFTSSDVDDYARNWFRTDPELTEAEAAAQADNFVADSSRVQDLRANALMLGLMCNLYKGSGYIPRNRPDVYEACAEMLFDRWDRLRQIDVGLNIESLLRPTMQHLAFWIYRDPELLSGVTEDDLIEAATAYLLGRRFDDPDEATLEARRFIEFCRGRAWVFTDTGTTPSGQRLYQFTHRTFLEFFAAGHLVRTNPSPEGLLEVLGPRISAKEWDVVAQLAFQLLDRNVDSAGNRLIESLLPEQVDPCDEGEHNRVDFVVRSLEFLVPSPAVTRSVASTAVDRTMAWAVATVDPSATPGQPPPRKVLHLNPVGTVLALFHANPENANAVRGALHDRLLLHLGERSTREFAGEVILNLPRWPLGEGADYELAGETFDDLVDASLDRLLEIAEDNLGIAQDLVVLGPLPVEALVEHHGLGSFFAERFYPMLPETGWVSIGGAALSTLLWGHTTGAIDAEQARDALGQLAGPLGDAEPPWYETASPEASLWPMANIDDEVADNRATIEQLTPSQRFALLALIGVYLEEEMNTVEERFDGFGESEVSDALREPLLRATLWPRISPIFMAKVGGGSEEVAAEALEALELEGRHRSTLERWLADEVSLVTVSRR